MSVLARVVVAWLAFAGTVRFGIATVFDAPERDRFNVGGLACYHGRPMRPTDAVVASRDLPCRSQVLVCLPRTGRCTVATVGDRGPMHVLIDLAPLVARRVRSNGWEAAIVVPVGGRR